jgi:hypothetical protein
MDVWPLRPSRNAPCKQEQEQEQEPSGMHAARCGIPSLRQKYYSQEYKQAGSSLSDASFAHEHMRKGRFACQEFEQEMSKLVKHAGRYLFLV